MTAPRLIGVGVGPGDPDLLTLRAVRVLTDAPVTVVPVEPGREGPGRAEALVSAAAPAARVVRVAFALTDTADGTGAGPARRAAWQAAADTVAGLLDSHGEVAFATLGDPSVYSTFGYLADRVRRLRPEAQITSVPGVMAAAALASAAGLTLVEGRESLALVPLTAGVDAFARALDCCDTVVAYKVGDRLGAAAAEAARRGRVSVAGSALGTPEQVLLRDPLPPTAPYFTTLAALPARPTSGARL